MRWKKDILRNPREEAMIELELRSTQEELSRDGGNALRRYADASLRRDLELPSSKPAPSKEARKLSTKGSCRWDGSLESFLVYNCALHEYDPDPVTLVDKCLARQCSHLKVDKRKEVTVKMLNEALRLREQNPGFQIEETKSGFRISKK